MTHDGPLLDGALTLLQFAYGQTGSPLGYPLEEAVVDSFAALLQLQDRPGTSSAPGCEPVCLGQLFIEPTDQLHDRRDQPLSDGKRRLTQGFPFLLQPRVDHLAVSGLVRIVCFTTHPESVQIVAARASKLPQTFKHLYVGGDFQLSEFLWAFGMVHDRLESFALSCYNQHMVTDWSFLDRLDNVPCIGLTFHLATPGTQEEIEGVEAKVRSWTKCHRPLFFSCTLKADTADGETAHTLLFADGRFNRFMH